MPSRKVLLKAFSSGIAALVATSFILASAHAADPINIGSVMDLSGPVATLGQYAKRGADVAVKEINAAGGINGRPLELISLNSESKPDLAASLGPFSCASTATSSPVMGAWRPRANWASAKCRSLS